VTLYHTLSRVLTKFTYLYILELLTCFPILIDIHLELAKESIGIQAVVFNGHFSPLEFFVFGAIDINVCVVIILDQLFLKDLVIFDQGPRGVPNLGVR